MHPSDEEETSQATRRHFVYEPDETLILCCCWLAGLYFLVKPLQFLVRHWDVPIFINAIFLILALIVLTLAPFSFLFYVYTRVQIFVSKRCTQRDRQQFADGLLSAIRDGEPPEYSLYLRPYFSDDVFKWRGFGDTSPDLWRYGHRLDLENAVTQAIDNSLPVVTLGGKSRGFGPGEIRVPDENWKRDILDLMTHARLIVAIPFAQPATMWEVKQLFACGFITKTVFLVPPLKGWRKFNVAFLERPASIRDVYAASQRVFKMEGIILPEMTKEGGIFWYEPNRRTWIYRKFADKSEYTPRELRRILFEVRPTEALRSLPLCE